MTSITSIKHTYDQQHRIQFPDWKINSGEHWLLLGESGSGKTTLLHILAGMLKPSEGKVEIDGTDLYGLSARALDRFRGKHIGVVFQKPHLIKSLTINENLKLAQSFANLALNQHRIDEVLDSLAILDKKNAYPNQMSQGQLQRASIARAVLNKPALLIADEPTSALDDKNTASVLELLQTQSSLNQATLIIATHDKRVKNAFTHTYELI